MTIPYLGLVEAYDPGGFGSNRRRYSFVSRWLIATEPHVEARQRSAAETITCRVGNHAFESNWAITGATGVEYSRMKGMCGGGQRL